MKLKDLFSKDIERDINGVVKVEKIDNEEIIYQELDEFVVTKELEKHFRTFYRNYNNSLEVKTEKVGVWISGFFGSGKSHCLKMLSYLLENKEVKGKKTINFFENKFNDSSVFNDIEKATWTPTETILFNIDSKSWKDSKNREDGIVEIFLRVFNKKLGYSSDYPRLANVERHLDKIGKLEEFKNEITSTSELTYEEAEDNVEFYKDFFIDAYQKVTGTSLTSTQDLFNNIVEDLNITPDGFAKLIKEYLESKGTKDRLIFLVDEIGQFISDNTNLMLNLQTVVENLGSTCNGRAWVIVTSQEAIDSITKERFKDQDFSKIIGRFDTKLSLSSSNTDEVIKRRLLEKKDEKKEILKQAYKQEQQILENLITFSEKTAGMKVYENETEFIDCYPFIPYQFKLLQDVFSALRNFSHAGAHLAHGERSMLNAFHAALQEYGDKEVGVLVPFNVFYETIKTFIDTDIVRIIERAKEDNKDIESFDIEVLIVLFLTKYIKEVPCDLENIATLMVDNADTSKNTLKSQIEASLSRLKTATLIQQDGTIYDFLTNEEQNVNRGIQKTQIDPMDITNEIYTNIFKEIFETNVITLPGSTPIGLIKSVDDITLGNKVGDLKIHVITSDSSDYNWSDNDFKLTKAKEPNVIYIKLKKNDYAQEIETILKTNKFTKQNMGLKLTEAQATILERKGRETLGRKTRVKELLEQAIIESTFFNAGDTVNVSGSRASEKIQRALEKVAENNFNKLDYVVNRVNTVAEIQARFSAKQQKLSEPNIKALNDIKTFLESCNIMNDVVTMLKMKNRYTRAPYGWTMNDVAGLVADLAANEDITINYNGVNIVSGDKDIINYLTNDKQIMNTTLKLKVKIDSEKVQQVSFLVKELFDKTNLEEDGDKLADQIRKDFIPEIIDELTEIKSQYKEVYPDKSVIDAGLTTFKDLKNEPDTNLFFDTLLSRSDNLKTWNEEYKLVKSFFNNQREIFDSAITLSNRIKTNQLCIKMIKSDKVDELMEKTNTLNEILGLEKPYSRIKEFTNLMEDIKTLYSDLVNEYKESIGKTIRMNETSINEEVSKCGIEDAKYITKYKSDIIYIFENSNDLTQLSSLEQASAQTYQAIIQQMYEDIKAKQQEVASSEEQEVSTTPKPVIKEIDFVNPSSVSTKRILETEQDVDDYIKELSEALKAKIKANKKVQLQ